ncbi:hypothetical protein L6164_017063 [Bauhinia variegata]|uniref:Uncharacterized protein n=1 Tax=Bauhinia variegata TaxID=167791 RepID=A0ACB9N6R1_BAUVA|nr:hypothetical protein L6164_017063 [Bauhinia variegata]
MSSPSIFLFLIANFQLLTSVSATEFIYNIDFNSTNIQLFGNATIEASILTITNASVHSIGRALYPAKIPTKSSTPLPFSTSFIFSISPFQDLVPGHGFVFFFTPVTDIKGKTLPELLGLFNRTSNGSSNNHVFGIEFDMFLDEQFNDIDDNHVGVDINSLNSVASHTAGFWGGKDDQKFEKLDLNNGVNYQVWIDYLDSTINVTLARAGQKKPQRPLISKLVNLSSVLLDEMYVGFSGSTGNLVQTHRILAWSFSNENYSIGDALVTSNLPSFVVPSKGSVLGSKGFIVGLSLGSFFVICCATMVYVVLHRRKRRKTKEDEIGDFELEYWPHRIRYEDIYAATLGFSDQNVIGFGRKTKVYKGVLQGVEVAVKRIPYESDYEMRQFLSEISSLGRLKHRNLVPLRGWCKKETGNLILVYDYMENGSLDRKLFDCDENTTLRWKERMRILKDVARGILYLHEGWEMEVLHRDIKASNVLLDKDMNARLGDFGLAQMHHHNQTSNTTGIIGTIGYIAPEFVRTGRVSSQIDVFSFGVLVLEVVCMQRQLGKYKPSLVGWIWGLKERGELYSAFYEQLKERDECSIDQIERIIHLGLSCTHPNPAARPTMRQVVKVLEGENLDTSLLDKINSAAAASSGYAGTYPTVAEIFQSHDTCSLTILLEGR